MFGKYFETAQQQQKKKGKACPPPSNHKTAAKKTSKTRGEHQSQAKKPKPSCSPLHKPKAEARGANEKRKASNNDASTRPSQDSKKRKRRHINSHQKVVLSQEALDLSKRLQELSRQKKLQAALDLYWNAAAHVKDAFHACIVVDCCARCGAVEEAQKIVAHLNADQINVETQTALLKALCHAGRMHAARDLFRSMMTMDVAAAPAAGQTPNVRTLNTLLRGCLWTAATADYSNSSASVVVAGGVETSEEAWRLYRDRAGGGSSEAELDASAFEYSISLLCQALRCQDAQERIQDFQTFANIRVKGKASVTGGDQQSMETLAVAYVGLARAYALRGEMAEMWQACQRVLSATKTSRALLLAEAARDQPDTTGSSQRNKNNKTAGGKRAFKKPSSEDKERETRRAASNQAYRTHRLNEIEAEALALLKLRKITAFKSSSSSSVIRKTVAHRLLCQLLYCSGGGTTEKNATASSRKSTEKKIASQQNVLLPTWTSFGLSQLVDEDIRETPIKNLKNKDLFLALGVPRSQPLDTNGRLKFKEIFNDAQLPVDIEVGAGFGDWISRQAVANTSRRNYIAVELRADRVAQIFARGVLDDAATAGSSETSGAGLGNLCVVGSECGCFLRDRVQRASISNIFANHPEPPTQTFGDDMTDLQDIMQGEGDEPAHMLNSVTIASMADCLKPNGRIVIVSDNRWFARLLSCTVVRAMRSEDIGLRTARVSELGGFRRVEVFGTGTNKVELLEGQPNKCIGHAVYDPKGASYFDRLWRSGAGSHAENRSRFVLVLHKQP